MRTSPRRHVGWTSSGRLALQLDRLEPRLALSTSVGTIGGVILPAPGGPSPIVSDPPSGSTVAQAPPAITVIFGQPIPPGTRADFRLDRVAADGSESLIARGPGLAESPDGSINQIQVSPPGPLGPGHYRLYLLGSSPLAGMPGGPDLLVDDFTVAPPSSPLAGATDLDSPVSKITTVTGSLDLADNPAATAYYKVELPQGHFWRLGVEVDAARIGSPLLAELSVLDAQGHPIASSVTGAPDAPNDPYEFLGLSPGTYYIAVAGRSDIASDPSGSFRLQVVADPADAATSVISATLSYADPTQKVPTGLVLQFSGPLDASAMAGHVSDLVQLVDDSGRTWTADATTYNVSTSSLTIVFDRALPAGHYTVVPAGQGTLVDLAGKSPAAPGLPAGALAQFTVTAAPASDGPTDYGPVFPGQARDGISATLSLAPGQEVTYRFVLTAGAAYNLITAYGGSAPTFTAQVDGVDVTLDLGTAGLPQNHPVALPPGVITLHVKAGLLGSTVDWSLLLANGKNDLLLDNGVGQASALGLRLITPTPLDGQAGLASLPAVPDGPAAPGAALPAAASATSPPSPGTTPVAAPAGSTGLLFAAGAGLVGHPSTQDDAIAVVGPVTPGGMMALSSSVPGIPQGLAIGFASRSRGVRSANSREIRGLVDAPESGTLTSDPGPAAPTKGGELPDPPEAVAEVATAEAPAGPGLFDRVSSFLAGLLPSGRRAGAGPDSTAALDDAALADLGRDSRRDEPDAEGAVEAADLSSPLGIGVLVVATAHYQRRLGHWLGRGKSRIVACRYESGPRGSHSRSV
jgi:hypothetical protein